MPKANRQFLSRTVIPLKVESHYCYMKQKWDGTIIMEDRAANTNTSDDDMASANYCQVRSTENDLLRCECIPKLDPETKVSSS
jgi:hypothetical protein